MNSKIFQKINSMFPEFTGKKFNRQISEISHQVKWRNLTYLSDQKILNIEKCIKEISKKQIPGIFAEFGVALGGSAIIIAKLMPKDRIFHGYDVFEMIPPPSDKDDEKSKARYEIIKSRKSTGINGDLYYGYINNLYEKVIENFKLFDLDVDNMNHIFLHKGFFQETIAFTKKDKIAFAHIDCDWYEPVKLCLESTYPILSKGGYIVLDDYHDYGGCKQAVNEFLTKHDDIKIVNDDRHLVLLHQ